MEENVLKSFETFDEFPDKYLKIDINSDYYYINKEEYNFVTKRNIDSISNIIIGDRENVLVKCSYYDVISGNLVYKTEFISDINGSNKEFIKCEYNIKIISLINLLNINGNQKYYLTKEDVVVLVNYKEENSKTYKLPFKRNYF